MIYTVKTVAGREKVVLESIAAKAKTQNLQIKSLFHLEEIKGYIFIEGELKDIEKVIKAVPHARGIIRKPIGISEIQHFLQPKEAEIELNVGDVVEIIGGPFKGEKGRIVRYDKVKRECTLELLEVTVPIPLTVSADFVKIIKKKKE